MTELGDALRIIGPGIGASFVTNLAPDPTLPGVLGYIPGVSLGERLAGFAGNTYDAAATVANQGLGTNLPYAPEWMKEWGDRAGATEQQIYQQLGGIEPSTPTQEYLKTGASAAGGFMLPGMGPSALLKAGLVGGTVGSGTKAALEAVQPEQTPQLSWPPTPEQIEAMKPKAPMTIEDAVRLSTVDPNAYKPQFSEAGKSPHSFGEALVYLAAAVVGVKAGGAISRFGGRISEADRAVRLADPKFAKEAGDYASSVAARTGDEISNVDAPAPPLPSANVINTFLEKAKTWGLDAAQGMQNFIRLTADNPRVSERLARQYGAVIDEQLWEAKNRQFVMTGYDPASGLTIPAPLRYVHDAERLGKAKFQQYNDALEARNELNNRDIMAQQRAARGEPPDPVEDRHNFYRQDRTQLQNIVNRSLNDPVQAALLIRHDQIMNGVVDIAEARGYITTADAVRIKKTHPNYLPEGDRQGKIRHVFGQRQLSPRGGIEMVNTKATSLSAQHIEELMRDIEMNDMQRNVANHILDVQRRVPNAPKWLYESTTPNPFSFPGATTPGTIGGAVSSREQVIPIRTSGGIKYYRTDSPFLFDGLTGENATRARIHFDSMGKVRRMLQAGTTGAASLVTGRIVPLRNIVFTALQAPINATDGMYGGPISALTRGKLPKLLTAPIDAPLNVVGALGQYGINLGSRMAMAASDAFRPENPNTLTQTLRSMVGDAPLRLLSNSLRDAYMNSTYYEGQTSGLGGQSLQQRMRMPVVGRDEGSNRTIRLQLAQLEPRILINRDGSGTARPFAVKLQRSVTDAFTHASEATHDFLYSLNRNNPAFRGDKTQVVTAVRNVVGDPSVSGIGSIPQTIRTHIPYSNVAVQGTRALGRAIANSPLDSLGAMVTSYGSLIGLAMLSAFQSQENLVHFTTMTSSQERATNLIIYNGGDGANSAIYIPFPAEARWLTGILANAWFFLMNMPAVPHDGEVYDDVLGKLKDLANEHIDKSTLEMTKHGINDAFNFIDMPPWMKFGLALGGGSGRIDLARIYNDATTGNLGMSSIINKPHDQTALPGEGPNDASARKGIGKQLVELLSTTFGLSSILGAYAFNLGEYHAQGNSWLDSAGYTGKDWLQGMMDFNPQGNTLLWENAVRASMQPSIIEQNQRALREMRKTDSGNMRDMGTTGGRNPLEVPVYDTTQGKLPQDPLMQKMYTSTNVVLKYLDEVHMEDINNIKKQMDAVGTMMLEPQERRKWLNNRTRDLADKHRAVAVVIDHLNDELSNMAGMPIDIRKGIDWHGDVSQFKK